MRTDVKVEQEDGQSFKKINLERKEKRVEQETVSKKPPEVVTEKNDMQEKTQACISVVDTFIAEMDEKERPVVMETRLGDRNREAALMMGLQNIQGQLGNSIYARINELSDGRQNIDFCQQYHDGSFSPIISIKQSDLLLAWKAIKTKEDQEDKIVMKRTQKFFDSVEREYLDKLQFGFEEMYDIRKILGVILSSLPMLPKRKSYIADLRREEFYKEIVDIAQRFDVEEHKEYFAFDDVMFQSVADNFELSKVDLIAKLEKLNLLFLNGSASGYKCNVRLNKSDKNKNDIYARCYCIRKIKLIDTEN